MTTAWETLTGNSSLDTGDAWDHLGAQQGGLGGTIIVTGSIEVDQVLEICTADIDIDTLTADVLMALTADNLSAELTADAENIAEVV